MRSPVTFRSIKISNSGKTYFFSQSLELPEKAHMAFPFSKIRLRGEKSSRKRYGFEPNLNLYLTLYLFFGLINQYLQIKRAPLICGALDFYGCVILFLFLLRSSSVQIPMKKSRIMNTDMTHPAIRDSIVPAHRDTRPVYLHYRLFSFWRIFPGFEPLFDICRT